jgi:hypothetical protein
MILRFLGLVFIIAVVAAFSLILRAPSNVVSQQSSNNEPRAASPSLLPPFVESVSGNDAGNQLQGAASGAVPVASTPAKASAPSRDHEWDAARPPREWPKFSVAPGEPALPRRTPAQTLSYARSIQARWEEFKSGRSKRPVLMKESSAAIRSLVAIQPDAPQYREAWAAFLRLRKINQEIADHEETKKPR